MNTIYIVDIEQLDTRYTGQWKWHLPKLLAEATNEYQIQVLEGTNDIPEATTPGAFLNFGGTNIYKASQLTKIAELFCAGKIKNGDKFLYTDAWNPTILQVKYMSALLDVKIELHGILHAGSYDPADFLGRLIGNAEWVRNTEKAMLHSLDYVWVATQFHKNLLETAFGKHEFNNVHISGFPFEYLKDIIKPGTKRDLILFPHRIAPEKQLPIFKELAARMPQYEWVVCQEKQLTKDEYHKLLGEAKIVFSANLQETLGIGVYEGALAGAIPVTPNRLSYTEMYQGLFQYPDTNHIDIMEYKIKQIMNGYNTNVTLLPKLLKRLDTFFSADIMISKLIQ
jgi:glycosyltransferase involved in cell wall biosynthesis